jgi:hypothetical protein
MSLLLIVPLISLGLYLVPVYLLRQQAYPRAQDYFVSSEHTPPGVIQNSSIAYALKMATFGPLFAWGASGDFWPAIILAVFFGLGVALMYVLRRPMLAFLNNALSRDRSVTVHEFIASQHGDDSRVRLLASGLTIFALIALVTGEAVGIATVFKPVLPVHAAATPVLIVGLFVLVTAYTFISGNSGVMRSNQAQLGMLYLGLFGSVALLLYLQISALRPMPPQGTFAVAWFAVFCLVLICYRRSRYVDTSPVRATNPEAVDSRRGRRGVNLFRRFEKILNVCVSVLVVLVIVMALMEMFSEGPAAVMHESAAALTAGTRMSTIGLAALVLLPLFYPIVDITNWQRIAAFEKSAVEAAQRPVAFLRFIRIYAVESALMLLFMCMFGTIAVVAAAVPADTADIIQAFIQRLTSQQNLVADCALSLLLVGVLGLALSTMSAAFSASLCAIRYDILPAFRPELKTATAAAQEPTAKRQTLAAGIGLCVVIALTSCLAAAYLKISFTSNAFLALLFAFFCAQLSFVPLILGPLMGRAGAASGAVRPAWALAILGAGAAAGIGAVAIYAATGKEPWLWAAVPACLAAGFVLFAVARMTTTSSPGS